MTKDNFKELKQKEVDSNFEYLKGLLSTDKVPQEKYHTYALMKNQKIIDYFTTWEDANQAGKLGFSDNIFSIQKINRDIIDLGYLSHAIF